MYLCTLFTEDLGPTGIDGSSSCVSKHAGSWDESLERWSHNTVGEESFAMAA